MSNPLETARHWTDPQWCEVHWYKRSGKHKDRIRADGSGRPYVIGDWSWNRMHRCRHELIEEKMRRDGVYENCNV